MKKILTLCLTLLFSAYINAQTSQSLNLNGEDDFILVPDNDALDLNTDFTVEAWVEMNEVEGTIMIFRKGWCNTDDNSYYLAVVDGKVRWFWDILGVCAPTINYYETTEEVIHINRCTHISVIHRDDSIQIFIDNELVDGVLIDGEYGTVHSSAEPLSIGAYRNSVGGVYENFFNGKIDEIRFWNYELSNEEIEHYSISNLNGSEEGLLVYFDMEDTGEGESLELTNKSEIDISPGEPFGFTASTPNFSESCFINSLAISENIGDQTIVYPNPFTDFTTVDFGTELTENHTIVINNLLGQEVYRNENIKGSSTIIKKKELEVGVYILSLLDPNSDLLFNIKLIVE